MLFSIYFLVILHVALFFHLPSWILNLGGDEFAISLTIASFGLGGILVRPISGVLIDKDLGKPYAVLASFTLLACSWSFFFLFQVDLLLYLVRFFQGVSFGMITGYVVDLSSRGVSASLQVQRVGYLTAFGSTAVGVSAPLGNYLIEVDQYQLFFVTATALVALGALMLMAVPAVSIKKQKPDWNQKVSGQSLLQLLLGKFSLPLWLFSMSFSIPMAGVFAFAKVYEESINSEIMSPLFISCISTTVLVRLFLKNLPMKLGFARTLKASVGLLFLSLSMLSHLTDLLWVCMAGLLLGLAQAFVVPLLVCYIRELYDDFQGLAIALLMGIFDGGSFFAGIIFGLLLWHFDFPALFLLLAVTPVVGLAFFLRSRGANMWPRFVT